MPASLQLKYFSMLAMLGSTSRKTAVPPQWQGNKGKTFQKSGCSWQKASEPRACEIKFVCLFVLFAEATLNLLRLILVSGETEWNPKPRQVINVEIPAYITALGQTLTWPELCMAVPAQPKESLGASSACATPRGSRHPHILTVGFREIGIIWEWRAYFYNPTLLEDSCLLTASSREQENNLNYPKPRQGPKENTRRAKTWKY